ncbi:MAG: hypothetical protein ACI4S3_09340, partial [Candidatus Gastranaerophilaceae bacterium]
ILRIILGITFVMYIYTEDKKNFGMTIGGIIIACLIPLLSDKTKTIINLLDYLTECINPKRYKKTLKIYNDRLLNFACHFYFFVAEILSDEQKEWLKLSSNQNLSLKSIAEAFNNLLKNGQPTFKRITKDNKETFSDESWNRFSLAQGELCDIYRILKSLPHELEFSAKHYPDFINIQSAFYQVKDNFTYNAQSRACEAFTEAFLKDLVKFLTIEQE